MVLIDQKHTPKVVYNNMGIYEFKLLDAHHQYDVLFAKGTFLDSRTEGPYRYVLYSLHDFWVQVSYQHVDNRIEGIDPFISGPLLDRFSIDLSNI